MLQTSYNQSVMHFWIIHFLFSLLLSGLHCMTFTNSSKCPASGVTPDLLLSAFDCSTFYFLTSSALDKMSKGKSEIKDLLNMKTPPDYLIAYDVPMCTTFHAEDQKCELETVRLFITDGVQLYNNEKKTEMIFPVGIGHGDSGCGSYQHHTSPTGNIDFKVGQTLYNTDISCHWTISTETNTTIVLLFSRFNIKYCTDSCLCDYLAIYTSTVNSSSITGKYCGQRGKWTMHSNSNLVHIILSMTVFYNTDPEFGFKFSYTSALKDKVQVLSTPERILATNGSISISDLKPCYKKLSQFMYEWQIRTDEVYHLSIHFSFSETCGTAHFSVYDGPKSDNVKIYSSDLSGNVTGTTKGSGFVALLQFQSFCKNSDLYITYSSKVRSSSYNYTADTESFREVSLNATQVFNEFNITTDRRKSQMFVGYIFNVPQGMYVTVNFTKFSFGGPNIRYCEAEGLVIWDGLPGSSDKYGPYCGTDIHSYIFEKTISKTYRIHSSSNVMSILHYWYRDSGFQTVNLELAVSPTKCMGVSDWFKLNTESTNATYSKSKGTTNINVTLNEESCVRLQMLPDEKPINTSFTLNWQIKAGILTVTEGWIHVEFRVKRYTQSDCDYRFYRTLFDANHGTWQQSIDLNCWTQPWSYALTFSTKSKENIACVNDVFEYYFFSNLVKIYHGTICGKIALSCSPLYRSFKFAIRAPTDMTDRHHYLLKFYSTNEMDTKISLNIKETKMLGYDYRLPALYITHLPFYWKSSWSTMVTLELTYKYLTPCDFGLKRLFLEYRLVQSAYPKPRMTEGICTGYTYRYKDHCYEILKDDDHEKTLTWSQAHHSCKERDGYLLTISTQEELSFIQGLLVEQTYNQINQPNRFYFLGLNFGHEDENKWTDGTPLTFTDWYKPLPLWHQPFSSDFFGVQFVSSQIQQPHDDPSSDCVIMVLSTPLMNTNWIKIPCKYPYKGAGRICKREIPDENKTVTDTVTKTTGFLQVTKIKTDKGKYITRIQPAITHCPAGWNYISGKCLKLLSSVKNINKSLSCNVGTYMCSAAGSKLITFDSVPFEDVTYLLKAWKHEPIYGAVMIEGCSVIENNYTLHELEETQYTIYETPESKVLNVLCETDTIVNEVFCQQRQFECIDGTCILDHHTCDGIPDCIMGEDESNCNNTAVTFLCENGESILMSKYCDFYNDCADSSDETNCTFPMCGNDMFRCHNGQCIQEQFKKDGIRHCVDSSDEKRFETGLSCPEYSCFADKCIPYKYYQNGRVDCVGSTQEDEPLNDLYKRGIWNYSNTGKLVINYEPYCTIQTNVRCHSNHVHCFPRHLTCVYDHDEYGFITNCADGSHLQNCENFSCPDMFKCPGSYCIPVNKICNGISDCIGGNDEEDCGPMSCPGLFKCREGHCIQQIQICDGVFDCPESHDDERLCDSFSCPESCECLGHMITCSNSGLLSLPNVTKETRYFKVAINQIKYIDVSLLALEYLGHLNLSHNFIEVIPYEVFIHLNNLLLLDLTNNKLTTLKQNMFTGLSNLQHLYLSGNPIMSLRTNSLWGMLSIKFLDLSNLMIQDIEIGAFSTGNDSSLNHLSLRHNFLYAVSPGIFENMNRLRILDLRGNDITLMGLDTFNDLQLTELHTDDYKFCCYAPHVQTCTPERDAYSSCQDLMANPFLQFAIWLLGFSAVFGNVLVIIWRIMRERKICYSFLVINLSISDFMMGIYLLIVASADVSYRGNYALHSEAWKKSSTCKVAGVISTLSSEMSVFMLVVITAERLGVIMFPFSPKTLSYKQAVALCSSGWTIFLILSVIPVASVSYFGDNFIENGVCLLFNIASGKDGAGWEYVTFLFLNFNLAAFLFIMIAYLLIYKSLSKTRKDTDRQVTEAELALTRRFAMIVATDFICWIPIIFTAFLALGGVQVNPQVSMWMAVFILPLNSAVNPFLYTFSMIKQLTGRKKVQQSFTTEYEPQKMVMEKVHKANKDQIKDSITDIRPSSPLQSTRHC